ncbi:hypothetical protein IWQ60_009594 [Tieghemiomyces parasiticus]|uniref:Zn(2)-C6 fungal-type domain-containing protein n=1 Tax=Tieghemiomyces parasiticus TaxID=78921 RepID=A0A9W7ZT85_9FUNG|nr:hypothetical protein IWQ60_009594 [Tieghemiomyces parasiticus]
MLHLPSNSLISHQPSTRPPSPPHASRPSPTRAKEPPKAAAAATKTRRVCDHCAARRFRCDGQTPCGSCQRRLYNCHYSPFAKRKPRLLPPKDKLQGCHSFVLGSDQAAGAVVQTKGVTVASVSGKASYPSTTPAAISGCVVPFTAPRSPYSSSSSTSPQAAPVTVLRRVHRQPGPLHHHPLPSSQKASDHEPSASTVTMIDYKDSDWLQMASDRLDHLMGRLSQFMTGLRAGDLANPIEFVEAMQWPPSPPCSPEPELDWSTPPPTSLSPTLLNSEDVFFHPGLVYPLIRHFFDNFVRFKPQWQKQRFMRRLGQEQVPRCLLASMLAYSAQMYSHPEQHRSHFEVCVTEYTRRAEALMLSEMEHPTLDTLTSALLLCLVGCNYCEVEKMDTFGSMALRLIFRMNLHRLDAPRGPGMNSVSVSKADRLIHELQRRTAWGVLSVCSIARLLGKISYTFDIDTFCMNEVDDRILQSLTHALNVQDGLPALIWPLFNRSFGLRPSNQLVGIASRLTDDRRRQTLGIPVAMSAIQSTNRDLEVWSRDLPDPYRLDRTSTRNRYTKTQPVVLDGLMHCLFYLCIYYNNSSLLLDPMRAQHAPAVRECEVMTRTSLRVMSRDLMVPLRSVPLALRPLNCFFYGYYGLQACLHNAAATGSLETSDLIPLINDVYHLMAEYTIHSKFSVALVESLPTMLGRYNVEWTPPASVLEMIDREEGENCKADDP